ncbi:MAG: tetraacyldisaccharide 4'-kinase [Hyphomicrobiaceae bacterium]|nr:tetraacyldisaccharide 4'-kinase [Hyphomicrobiaceae bacterium]
MSTNEPSWWYRPRRGWQALVLSPATRIYGAIAGRRMARAPNYTSKLPVLCVGNFTAGGTGKTPLSIALAEIVTGLGREPVFVTRGYGGSATGPLLVDAHASNATQVGDEPLLLARAAPTVLARNRADGARFIERSFSSNAVIIMDDGLQNPSLRKLLSVALVDARRRFGNRMCLPSGPLRAPLTQQMSKVDLVILNGEASDQELTQARHEIGDVFSGTVLRARVAGAGDFKWLNGARVVAFAGIANPDRFFTLLQSAGAQIEARQTYRDHHHFTDADADALLALAETHRARLVTTEKDFVRLYGADGSRGVLRENTLTVPITLQFSDDDLAALSARVEQALNASSGGVEKS